MAAGSKKKTDAGEAAGTEVSEDQVRVVERAAAIDVAKGSGMVCTRCLAAARTGGGRRYGR